MLKQSSPQLADYVSAKETELGLRPGELLALWAQESGKSGDTRLKGQALSRDRGNAIGPFQVVPFYHNDFPVDGTFQEQADYAANLYKSGGDTVPERLAKYYGTGKAPTGHPTTDQYIASVIAMMGEHPARHGEIKMEPQAQTQPMTLPQAAQSNNVAGALQQLLMSRIPTPEQESAQRGQRATNLAEYQAALRAPAYGDYTPKGVKKDLIENLHRYKAQNRK